MNVDNQPVGIGQKKSRVLGHIIHVENHAGQIRLELRYADLVQEAIFNLKSLTHHLR